MKTTSEVPLAIEARDLVKRFGAVHAVDHLDLSVPAGGVFALLGPNGAGKTTTIRIFATLTRPDGGLARVLGHDVTTAPHAVRSGICLTGQFATVDPSLTGTENLVLQARLLGLARRAARARAAELLEAFGLADAAGRPVRTYSGGMQRRLDIAASLVVAPALLFLDEPTTGLDPYSRVQVWDAVRWLVARGTTVLLTTQYLEEADQLSDRIAVVDHGRIVAEGTPAELKSSVGSATLRVRLADTGDSGLARQVLSDILGVPVTQDADPAALTATIAPRTLTGPGRDATRRPRMLRNTLTMAWRGVLRIRREPELLTDAIFIPVLFTLFFTYLFGGALAGSPREYLGFLLPGTLVLTVLLITVTAGVSLNTDRARGTLDRFRSMPVWQPSVVVGGLIGDMGRYVLATCLVLGMGLLMGYRPPGGAGGAALAVALILVFAFSVSWIWTALGLALRSAQGVTVVSFAVQLPLTFASNVFVRPATLPGWLRAFVDVNPVSHLVTAERALMNGTPAGSQAGWVLLASAALIAVFGPLTMRLYRADVGGR